MARYFVSSLGRIVNCPFCKEDFKITEKCLHQPSYEIRVYCPECDEEIYELAVWSTYDKDNKRLFDKSTEDVFQEAIDMYGFLPHYDRDGFPLTFTSSAHKNKSMYEGYELVVDIDF